jgi:hypothetical protein
VGCVGAGTYVLNSYMVRFFLIFRWVIFQIYVCIWSLLNGVICRLLPCCNVSSVGSEYEHVFESILATASHALLACFFELSVDLLKIECC